MASEQREEVAERFEVYSRTKPELAMVNHIVRLENELYHLRAQLAAAEERLAIAEQTIYRICEATKNLLPEGEALEISEHIQRIVTRLKAAEEEGARAITDTQTAIGRRTLAEVEAEQLRTRAERAEANERRYQWLKERLYGANFEYELDEDDTMSALIFMLPEGAAVSANLDATIDAFSTTQRNPQGSVSAEGGRDGQGA